MQRSDRPTLHCESMLISPIGTHNRSYPAAHAPPAAAAVHETTMVGVKVKVKDEDEDVDVDDWCGNSNSIGIGIDRDPLTAMRMAVMAGDVRHVVRLLRRPGAYVVPEMYSTELAVIRATPLYLASTLGNVGVVRALVRDGRALRCPFQSNAALLAAAQGAHLGVVELLLDAPDSGLEPGHAHMFQLSAAAPHGSGSCNDSLLCIAAERWPDSSSPLVSRIALLTGPHLCRVKNGRGMTPLMLAAAQGHCATVRELLAMTAHQVFDLDPQGHNARELALSNGHPSVAQLLWEAEARLAGSDSITAVLWELMSPQPREEEGEEEEDEMSSS